jgi:hypothetical protein
MKTFNVVIATTNRPTLKRMVDSIAFQLSSEDYITLIYDTEPTEIDIQTKANIIKIKNSKPLGSWGHGSRTAWQKYLPGDYIMNADDDDVYTHNAMDIIRENCVESRLYIFQMLNNGITTIPRYHKLEMSNIGTPCGVYPNIDLPEWKPVYGGDFEFYNELSKKIEYTFIDKIIYIIKPNDSREG